MKAWLKNAQENTQFTYMSPSLVLQLKNKQKTNHLYMYKNIINSIIHSIIVLELLRILT